MRAMFAFTRNFGRNPFQPAECEENDNRGANCNTQFKDIALHPRRCRVPIILDAWNYRVWLNALDYRNGFCCHISCVRSNAPLNNLPARCAVENERGLAGGIFALLRLAYYRTPSRFLASPRQICVETYLYRDQDVEEGLESNPYKQRSDKIYNLAVL